MNTLIVSALLLAGATAVLMNHLSISTSTLRVIQINLGGFPSDISTSFGEDKAKALINFINAAGSIYRDDLERNLKYIQLNMDVSFGEDNRLINVIIQESSTDRNPVIPAVFPNITAYASLPNECSSI